MTAEEERNLAVTRHWVETYNDAVERMVDECYAPDCVVEDMANGRVFRGREELRKLELEILARVPTRRMNVSRMIASGDAVTIETTAGGFDDASQRPLHACIVLTYRDGLIVSDHTYAARPSGR